MADPPKKSKKSVHFPSDLLFHVLPRLPMKIVTRFKLVSKDWLNVIEEDRFREVYNSRAINADNKYMIINYEEKAEPFGTRKISDPYCKCNFALLDVLDSQEIEVANVGFPFPVSEFPWHPKTHIIGSDFGLVCVAVPLCRQDFPRDYPLVKGQIQIYLWNPAAKESKTISPPPVSDLNVCIFGFGYDSTDDVFKVVCITRTGIAVYSTRDNSWHQIDLNDFSFRYPVRLSFDLCLHGYLIGVARYGMMSFGLNNEVFTSKLKLPVLKTIQANPPPNHLMRFGRVVEFKDSVAYCLVYQAKVCLWTLNDEACFYDNNVNASWTLKNSFILDPPAAQLTVPHDLCLFNDQQVIVENYYHNIYFQKIEDGMDVNPNAARYVSANFKLSQAFKYRESLVVLPGFKTVGRRKEDMDSRIIHDTYCFRSDIKGKYDVDVRVQSPDPLIWSKDGRHFLGDFSFATVQATADMEDYSQVETTTNATFIGVYDGHGGSAASRYIRDHLFVNLTTIVEQSGKMSNDELTQAFAETEAGFLSFVEERYQDDPLVAAVGSCCLVGVICEEELFVANVGHSRAAIGRVSGDQISAAWLTYEDDANIPRVRNELMSAHPSDPKIVSQDKEDIWRVKGIIQVTRSIGDAYLKKPGFALDPRSRVFLKEPLHQPVLSADPKTNQLTLTPGDMFLIFASDGLWERCSVNEVVQFVNNNPRPDISKRLIEATLRFPKDIKKLGKGCRRMYHDDITVIVIFLDKKWPEKNDVQEESVLGGA